ncbi:MAG: arginine--tRNA ligase [Betaproteobacteria bacterium]|nr:arginine--tRNA ligase [Betaproteobacteria bacterium]
MLSEQKLALAALFSEAARSLAAGVLAPESLPVVELDRPRQADHGDLACNLAMQLARPLKQPPRKIAEALAQAVQAADAASPQPLLAAVDVAGPGFINLRLAPAARRAVVARVLEKAETFGCGTQGAGRSVVVEFVSANPTGPLHVGHGRQAALGDALCALLGACGWRVSREFYYNDAGAQIANLAASVQARVRGLETDDPRFPADGYRGDYIREIAADYLAGKTVAAERVAPETAAADPDDLEAIRRFAVAYLRREQDNDLRAFGVRFDTYYLESSLYTDGRVDQTVNALAAAGVTFEHEGALWLRSTQFGDDKDRVMRKSEGGYTYFVPDVAYHVTKWQRGFERAVNIQGSDHHGTIARVRAGLQALAVGIPAGYPQYVLHKMVTVMRGGEEVKISKRAGAYVTLRDLITWSGERGTTDAPGAADAELAERRGRDAVRFFLVSRKADSEFVFDIDLALSQSDDNPVYYVQYAHARICSVFEQASRQSGEAQAALEARIRAQALSSPAFTERLDAPRESLLMARLAEFPELVAQSAEELAPHALAFFLKELAADLHAYYNSERFLVDDIGLREARLALLLAVRQVLRNGLALLGVSAPEKM